MRFSPPFRIRVLLSTETEEQKKRGRPGNEASVLAKIAKFNARQIIPLYGIPYGVLIRDLLLTLIVVSATETLPIHLFFISALTASVSNHWTGNINGGMDLASVPFSLLKTEGMRREPGIQARSIPPFQSIFQSRRICSADLQHQQGLNGRMRASADRGWAGVLAQSCFSPNKPGIPYIAECTTTQLSSKVYILLLYLQENTP